MRKTTLIFFIFMVVFGLLGLAQIIQMQVQIYPQQVLANAPFRVFVSAYSASGEPISFITATFNGVSLKATGSTASFEFTAPSLEQAIQNLPIEITAETQSGQTFSKESVITISINANPVIQIEKPIPSNESYIGNTNEVKIPIKVYGGLGLDKIEFMIDTQVASIINVSPSATVYLSRTFEVDITHMKNGWHIFSVKAVNVAGEIFSSISAYVIDVGTPVVRFVDLKNCLPANANVPIKVSAVSTISGIANVSVNGVQAKLLHDSTWKATILTPNRTGPFEINAVAVDAATNKGYATFSAFLDGLAPTLFVTSDASLIKNGIAWGKYSLPTFTFMATTACSDISPNLVVNTEAPFKIFESYDNGYKAQGVNFSFPKDGSYKITLKTIDPINELTTYLSTNVSVMFYPNNPEITSILYSKYVGPNEIMAISISATDGEGPGIEKVLVNNVVANEVDGKWIANISSGNPETSGYRDFTIEVYDYLGRVLTKTYQYYVDTHAPQISITPIASLYSNGIYWNKDTPFKVNVNVKTDSGVPPVTKVIIDQDPQIYNGKNFLSIALTVPGTYTITVISTNTVNGMSDKVQKTYQIKFDTIKPEIKIFSFPRFVGPSRSFTVKMNVQDEFGPGIKNVLVNDIKATSIDPTTWVATLSSPNLSKSGNVSVVATAVDLLDLSSQAMFEYFLDAQPPHVTINPVAALYKDGVYWNIENSYIEVFATTDSKIPESIINLNGKSIRMTTSSTKIVVDKNGTYNVSVLSTNSVNGFVTSVSTALEFAFDRMDPKIKNVTYPATVGPQMPLPVKVLVEDQTGIGIKQVLVNNINAKFDNSTWIATLTSVNLKESGMATFSVKAIDFLGRSSYEKRNYFVDIEPPMINVYLNGQKIQNDAEFYEFKKATPVIAVKVKTDGMVKPDVNVYVNGKLLDMNEFKISGINILQVKATNPVNGKSSEFLSRLAIFVDPHAPDLELHGPSNVNMTSDATFVLSVNGKDLRYAILNLSLNGKPLYFKIFNENGRYEISLRKVLSGIDEKSVAVELRAEDMAGNISTLENTIYVDTVGPKIVSVNVINDTLNIDFDKSLSGTPVVKIEDLKGHVVDLGMGFLTSNTIQVKINVPYGPYVVIVDGVTDNDGNPLMNNHSIWEF